MPISEFPELLSSHMRRIRASAADVASEIGLSREAVNNWRNGHSTPNPKHRDKLLACARYLRLTEQESNALLQSLQLETEYPVDGSDPSQPYAEVIAHLFDRLQLLSPYPILMLLSQAHWGQPPYRDALLQQARQRYGADDVVHIQPPYSVSMASADYFAAIGRQCGLDGVTSDFAFEAALERRLAAGDRLYCLVSRFEQGIAEHREALAGILRSLSEMHSGKLHLMLCGSAALADLKYQGGDLSLLNIASVESWPEMDVGQARAIAQAQLGVALDTAETERCLRLAGGHPVLLGSAVESLAAEPALDDAELGALLAANPCIWQGFLPALSDPQSTERVARWLQQPRLARTRPYLIDTLLRQLYWANLIAPRTDAAGVSWLEWRCEPIRQAGLMIVEQCASC